MSTTHDANQHDIAAAQDAPMIDASEALVRLGLAQYESMAGNGRRVAGLVEAQRIVRELAGIPQLRA
ncbi:hypothetical protein CFN78_16790 [Amycolatopsis antarctica]|uniref:Uncharacterized protein n=1 Tax=Amycolatopsis antarctica TaxID=1854586 RepID=A0A263D133_9PSEU|nr:hypothetical protein [Amycolatopsis antarctica]OZM72184.1 hypothetical protein CFN78_16790 [Amycolatopsis antarctica]